MKSLDRFSLTVFSTQPDFIRRAVAAGVDEIIVDWENRGKQDRQAFADTEINHDTLDDLRRVRACTDARVICRVNPFDGITPDEVEQAVGAGADEILLPMVRSLQEVAAVLSCVNGRCGVGILIETVDAVRRVEELARLPLSRVYVGLNDLAIERSTPNIFTALADGTVERIRRSCRAPFGFGGLTLPERGHPIPCRLLIGEMARLNTDFSFLRRSFYRDVRGRDVTVEVPRILEAIRQSRLRSPQAVAQDRSELELAIRAWSGEINHTQEFGTLAHRSG